MLPYRRLDLTAPVLCKPPEHRSPFGGGIRSKDHGKCHTWLASRIAKNSPDVNLLLSTCIPASLRVVHCVGWEMGFLAPSALQGSISIGLSHTVFLAAQSTSSRCFSQERLQAYILQNASPKIINLFDVALPGSYFVCARACFLLPSRLKCSDTLRASSSLSALLYEASRLNLVKDVQ